MECSGLTYIILGSRMDTPFPLLWLQLNDLLEYLFLILKADMGLFCLSEWTHVAGSVLQRHPRMTVG
jgi:hypothetical protein